MPVLYIYMRTWMKPTSDARRLGYRADDVSCGDRPRRYYYQTCYYKRVRETGLLQCPLISCTQVLRFEVYKLLYVYFSIYLY